jgi:hypothetical protein
MRHNVYEIETAEEFNVVGTLETTGGAWAND